jgi:hypothetical protein
MEHEYESKSNWKGIIILVAILGILTMMILRTAGNLILDSFKYAQTKSEIGECEKWSDWEKVYPEWNAERQTGYYVTKWQKEQCDAVGVELDAHVLQPNEIQ